MMEYESLLLNIDMMLAGHTFSCSKQSFWLRQALHPFNPNTSRSMLSTNVSDATEVLLQVVFHYPNFRPKKTSKHETSASNCASERYLLPLELALVPVLDDLDVPCGKGYQLCGDGNVTPWKINIPWNPGWLIWILIMSCYTPHITRWHHPLHPGKLTAGTPQKNWRFRRWFSVSVGWSCSVPSC